jgi:sporulation protein YlmC with PRC-barrel domain
MSTYLIVFHKTAIILIKWPIQFIMQTYATYLKIIKDILADNQVLIMRISEIYNMDVYADNGQYLGEVQDAIVDLEKGEVSRLLMEQWRNLDRTETKRILQNKSVLFKNVRNIGDVVLVTAPNASASTNQAESPSGSAEMSDLMGRR